MRQLTAGEFFAGIGGISLGLQRAGMEIRWHSEIDPYASRVLAKHWPGVPNLGDIRRIDYRRVEPVDVLAGGFPCQNISNAGKREGIDGEQSGLWSEYARAIGELRPRYVFVENVAALLARGLDRVLGDLAALGYDAEWDCIPASAVGAPHRRDRLWLVAYAERPRRSCGSPQARRQTRGTAAGLRGAQPDPAMADANAGRRDGRAGREFETHRGTKPPYRRSEVADPPLVFRNGRNLHRGSDKQGVGAVPQLGIGGGADGPAAWWITEPDVGRVAHGVPARVDRLRGLGNAVVPQIAELIGGWIIEHARATAHQEAA